MMETHELSERRRKLRKKAITLRGVYEGSVADDTAFTEVNFENLRTPRTESTIICLKQVRTTRRSAWQGSIPCERGDNI